MPIVWDQNNLPTWRECRRIIEDYDYRDNHTIESNDNPIPTALHVFIYENEPADTIPEKVNIFKENLIATLNNVPNLELLKNKIRNSEGILSRQTILALKNLYAVLEESFFLELCGNQVFNPSREERHNYLEYYID